MPIRKGSRHFPKIMKGEGGQDNKSNYTNVSLRLGINI